MQGYRFSDRGASRKSADALTELVREGAMRLIAQALQAEFEEFPIRCLTAREA